MLQLVFFRRKSLKINVINNLGDTLNGSAADDGGEGDNATGRRGYHHGRLKDALIEAARDLIEQRGPQGFSLTEAARLVGVTPAAPYRHFSDRDALMGEVARRGFELFNDRLRQAWNEGRPEAETAFSRMGRAYLDFARQEPGYYRSMFTRAPELDASCPPGGVGPPVAAAQSFALLNEAAGAVLRARRRSGCDPAHLALQVWALSHGAATLMLGGYLPGAGGSDAYSLLESGLRTLVRVDDGFTPQI
ncbi:MAG: TetR/AcrR family transcriptional regulator [Beijerinckiaceae bacterium]|nr:TetR/AcrR family transcriptional regulator [Beijerinckiaceae bacterium]